jgi:hypothetical protein
MKTKNSVSSMILAGGAMAALGLGGISQAAVSVNGLIGYYSFDSNTAADTSAALGGSASANDGAWTGTATYKTGYFGRASEVGDGNGSNYITATGAEYNFGTGSFTVVYWVNIEAPVSSDPVLVAGGGKNWSSSGGSLGWVSAINDDNVKANISDGSTRKDSAYIDLDQDTYWGDGQDHWSMVALVVDRNGQTLSNYVVDDNVTVSSTTYAAGVTGQDFGQDSSDPSTVDISGVGDLTAGNTTIVLGQDGDLAGYSLPASGIDDLSVWSRPLSRAELWEIYAEGRSNGNPLSAVVVPEPSSSAIFLGLLGLGLIRRKR